MLAQENVAVVQRCGGHFYKELAALRGRLGQRLEGKRIIDLPGLAGFTVNGGEKDCLGHFGVLQSNILGLTMGD